jgi:hypothetical protein
MTRLKEIRRVQEANVDGALGCDGFTQPCASGAATNVVDVLGGRLGVDRLQVVGPASQHRITVIVAKLSMT